MNRKSPKEIEAWLLRHKWDFDHPEVYIGKEPNTHHKEWTDDKLKVLVVGLWRYEDNRGNQTLSLLYQMLNRLDNVICERAFFPNTVKDYTLFCDYEIPIFGLESKHEMRDYDIVMTSLSFVPSWLNMPLLLHMSGIPVRWYEREPEHPIVMVGGSSVYGNFSLVYPIADVIYLGDAESGLVHVIEGYKRGCNLRTLDSMYDFLFVPYFYTPIYENEQFVRWEYTGDGKQNRKIIRASNLDNAEALVLPIPSYTDPSMGLGEIELSRGCRASCVYCGLGWKYRPYRERSREHFVELMKQNKTNSGTFKGLCPIAAEFAFYSEKRALFNDLRSFSSTVDPLSMRVDAFAGDEAFTVSLSESGMNNLAIGVEGISQRIRNWMMKGITEEDIFKACKIAIDSRAFRKIKFFLISNVGETEADYDEFYNLLGRIMDYRREKKSKLVLKVSWTPLFVEPCTPLQWKHPTIEDRQPWKEISGRLDALGVQYPRGGGGKNEENFLWVMQGMHLGDTRFAEAIVDASLERNRPFFVSHAKDMKEVLTKYLKIYGYEWSYLLRERGENEVFPWDIVDRGVTKKALRTVYNKIVSGELDNKVSRITVPFDTAPIKTVVNYEENVMEWYLVRYTIRGDFSDTVPNIHWIARLHRACYIEDIKLAVNSMHFLGDRAHKNYYVGEDYMFMGMREPFVANMIGAINRNMCDAGSFMEGMFILNVKHAGTRKPKWSKYYSEYEVETNFNVNQLQSYYMDLEEAEDRIVLIPETRYFSGERKKPFNIKTQGVFNDVEIEDNGICASLKVKLSDKVGIRYFLKGLCPDVSRKRMEKFAIRKTNLFFEQSQNHFLKVDFGE